MTGLGSYNTGWLEDVDLDALEEFRESIGGGCLADLTEQTAWEGAA